MDDVMFLIFFLANNLLSASVAQNNLSIISSGSSCSVLVVVSLGQSEAMNGLCLM